MKRISAYTVAILLWTGSSVPVCGQSQQGSEGSSNGNPEFGWVVASILNVDSAEALASRYRTHDDIEAAVMPASVGRSRRFRVVVGRYPDRKAALGARRQLPPFAPPDSWLIELPPPLTANVGESPAMDLPEDSPGFQTVLMPRTDLPKAPVSTLQAPINRQLASRDSGSEDTTSSDVESISTLDVIRQNHLRIELQYLNRYDSNIDHDEYNLHSFGMVPAVFMQFRTSRSKPVFELGYLVARHNYTGTDRWDRFSHLVKGKLREDRGGSFRTETQGEISLAGTSEDRDLSNEYQARQEVEYRPKRDYRLRVYGTLRWKHYDLPQRNHFKPNVGAEFEQKLDNGGSVQFGVRWETKRIEAKSSRYKRWTVSLQYVMPVSSFSDLKFSVENRKKLYQFKDVTIDKEKVLRRDFRWKFDVSWIAYVTERIRVDVGYKFEHRDSNDPQKVFDAHMIDTGISYRL